MTSVELDRVALHRQGAQILRDIDLRVESGSVLGVIGASGSGKTSVLRVIAGLDLPTSGAVVFDGADMAGVAVGDRDVAMVFQQPALSPRRSVARNIGFPLEVRRETAEEIRRRVGAEARALQIESLLDRPPAALSAGEAQIVQIARAMVRFPAVLLLDEPFVHLDLHRASEIRSELSMIRRAVGITTVIATNDRLDAMVMCDQLAVIEEGRITQVAAPLAVYDSPRTAAAAMLTGDAELLDVRVVADGLGVWLEQDGFQLRSWRPAVRAYGGRRLQMIVRPQWWRLDEHGDVPAIVERVLWADRAGTVRCRIGARSSTVEVGASVSEGLSPGDRVRLRLERFVLLDPRDGYAIDP